MHHKIYIITYLIHISILGRFRYERKRHILYCNKGYYDCSFRRGTLEFLYDQTGREGQIFQQMIMSITLIPMDKFIIFLDEMCKEFFNNDKMQYVTFGKVAAQFALSPEGPYKSYLLTKDIKQFVESVLPKLWSTYFDEGIATAKLENNVAHLKITGLQIKHIYFEYLVMGYFQQALKMFGKKTVAKQDQESCIGR